MIVMMNNDDDGSEFVTITAVTNDNNSDRQW
jgi:hypothetical protein